MNVEYDPAKSASNLSKHGIDFDQAQALWDDPWMLEAPARHHHVTLARIAPMELEARAGSYQRSVTASLAGCLRNSFDHV